MLCFSANISMLFREVSFLDRFHAAADAGFTAVEFHWPEYVDLDAIIKSVAKAGMRVALFNTDAGSLAHGNRGYLNDPSKCKYVLENFHRAIDLALELQCPRLNPLVGNALPGVPRSQQLAHITEILKEMVYMVEPLGISLNVEALNSYENPNYLLTNTSQSMELLQMVENPCVMYQYDIYHLQLMEGNIISTLQKHISDIGHIQIADPPGRHQPGTGELNIRNILEVVENLNYDRYIGLEYNPKGTTEESLSWIPREKRALCTFSDLNI